MVNEYSIDPDAVEHFRGDHNSMHLFMLLPPN